MGNEPKNIELEASAIVDRYARRDTPGVKALYSPFNPSVYLAVQERERALIRLLTRLGSPVESMTVLEIGCGTGGNLAELIKLGLTPENLCGIDLLEERVIAARHRLPSTVPLIQGDALSAELPRASYDIVYVSTVFSSILDEKFQELLARRMWSMLKPGGIVLWYDFVYNNPNNADVRGVKLRRIAQLFPQGVLHGRRVTLAPPISRRVTKLHPSLYTLFNCLPFLRTHILCDIQKAMN